MCVFTCVCVCMHIWVCEFGCVVDRNIFAHVSTHSHSTPDRQNDSLGKAQRIHVHCLEIIKQNNIISF